MKPLENDPVDHARTFRRRAGETVTYGPHAPGVYGAVLATAALIVGLYMPATGGVVAGCVAVTIAAVLGAVSAGWTARTHRKVRDAELRWHESHSDEPAPPPGS
ncbi:MAG: hypothetical protein P4L48_02560 [Mycobacterium sp.]|nr:hypothetical protein [Mycobacterium sp.]